MTLIPKPLRRVVLFNLGPPFGGFRMSIQPRALGLANAEAFTVLEAVVKASFARVEQVAWTEWSTLREQLDSDAALKVLSPRPGFVDFHRHDDPDGTRHLVARAFLPFPAWPLGGWAVYDGRHFTLAGGATPFTEAELDEVW
jgi:hypothetical protein